MKRRGGAAAAASPLSSSRAGASLDSSRLIPRTPSPDLVDAMPSSSARLQRGRTSAGSGATRRHASILAGLCLGLALGLVLLSAPGCKSQRGPEREAFHARESRVDIYLRTHSERARSILLDFADFRLRSEDGTLVALDASRPRVLSEEAARGALVAGRTLPPARYDGLIVVLRAATLQTEGTPVPLLLLPPTELEGAAPPAAGEALELTLPIDLEVREHDSATLFLELDIDGSLIGTDAFRPLFVTRGESRQVLLGRLFVADRSTGSVLLVERDSLSVVSSAKVGPGPVALALSSDRRQVFSANSGDGSLSVLDARQGQTISTIPIRVRAETVDIALVDRGRLLVALNQGLDSVTFVDALGFGRLAEVSVGRGPRRLASCEEQARVFVANTLADTLSVLDVRTREVVATVPAGAGPSALAVDRRDRELWVGHSVSPDLVSIDTRTLARNASIYVGADVTAVLADRRRDRLYVARARPPELAIVDTRLSAVLRRIPLAGAVERLAQPLDGSSIYACSSSQGLLIEVDVIRGRVVSSVPCGRTPAAVLVID